MCFTVLPSQDQVTMVVYSFHTESTDFAELHMWPGLFQHYEFIRSIGADGAKTRCCTTTAEQTLPGLAEPALGALLTRRSELSRPSRQHRSKTEACNHSNFDAMLSYQAHNLPKTLLNQQNAQIRFLVDVRSTLC